MATPTYELIETTTLASSASSVSFSSITQEYRDLVLVMDCKVTGNAVGRVRFNSDTGSNYSFVQMIGNGSIATSNSNTLDYGLVSSSTMDTASELLTLIQIMDYSATDKHKSYLTRQNLSGTGTVGAYAVANRWANTAALTNMEVYTSANNFATGSTFSLYGIAA